MVLPISLGNYRNFSSFLIIINIFYLAHLIQFLTLLTTVECFSFHNTQLVRQRQSCFQSVQLVNTKNYPHFTPFSDLGRLHAQKIKIPDESKEDIQRKQQKRTNRNSVDVYLFTFPSLYPKIQNERNSKKSKKKGDTPTLSKSMNLLKQWKYHVLGDGGVYFDQRPNTLPVLNSFVLEELMGQLQSELEQFYNSTDIYLDGECAIISTCKRFEILVTIESKVEDYGSNTAKVHHHEIISPDRIQNIISTILTEQIMNQRRRLKFQRFLPFLSLPLDRPSRVTHSKKQKDKRRKDKYHQSIRDTLQKDLSHEMIVVDGVHDVALRLLTLASGLLDRPIFRPFSSRDAHIMNQLKRSLYGSKRTFTTRRNNDGELNARYTKILLDSALQAGKASRSPKVVPILDELRLASNGADGPVDLSAKAASAALVHAIHPILNVCLEKFKASEASDLILSFRNDVKRMTSERGLDLDKDEGKEIRRLLHQPMLELRKGNDIDIDSILNSIEKKIS